MPNAYQPHVLILPEDAACRDIANGFVLGVDHERAVRVCGPSGGWRKTRDILAADKSELARWPQRRLVAIVDFDAESDRAEALKSVCRAGIADRIYVVGALTETEDLRRALLQAGKLAPNTREGIGRMLADDCRYRTEALWSHALLAHNAAELARMNADLRTILFTE
ncbi:MAG: hypothetical protein GX446_02960 [Chthonomonadales bacterium]|nr:hypothetical protein [Chthonomonadales bacterium]